MSTRPPSSPNLHADHELESLLVEAGPREEMPQDALHRIRNAARESWSVSLKQGEATDVETSAVEDLHAQGRRWSLALLAATVVLAAALAYLFAARSAVEPEPRAPVTVAVLETGALESGLDSSGALLAGATLETADVGAALRFPDGKSVRLDRETRLRAHGATDLELMQGAVYIDNQPQTPDSSPLPSVVIRTPLGSATDIGTQFEVRLAESSASQAALVVRVREGTVRVHSASNGPDLSGAIEAKAGQAVTLSGSGHHQIEAVATFGETWDWVLELAPLRGGDSSGNPPSLHEVLSWATREAGWHLEYGDDDTQTKAHRIEANLPAGLRADTAALLALEATTLVGQLESGTLKVSMRP